MARRYSQEQLGQVFERSAARNWGDVLVFLDARPDQTGLNYDQIAEMEDDLQKLKDRGEHFSPDAVVVYQMVVALRPARVPSGAPAPPPSAT